ncbi:MAG: aspartate kinase [Bacteroidota bacterium]|jgi:aspartate kinase
MKYKVFKFGGASVKDAAAVKNVAEIIKRYPNEKLIVVISAMGKTTNALEKVVSAFQSNNGETDILIKEVKDYHYKIMNELFNENQKNIFEDIDNLFVELAWASEGEPGDVYDKSYDQIVSMGEIISTKIISHYLDSIGIKNHWIDARGLISTDDTYREGKVNFEETQSNVTKQIIEKFKEQNSTSVIVPGFIGGTQENYTTTLGREGSDFTAAILAYCTDAESVTIWKDVSGVLNADPKWFDNTQKIEELTYQDAIELTYYGATVIHPKTIKPLQNKNIPLYVKSFIKPDDAGTTIKDSSKKLSIPSFIFKINQILISIQPKDFSFIAEDRLSNIFNIFHKHNIHINVMQLSAINFSVCVDQDERKIPLLMNDLHNEFKVLYNENLELCTIRYFDQSTIERVSKGKQILLEQRSRFTVQLVMRA